MRIVVLITVSVTIGAVIGLFGARFRLAPELERLAEAYVEVDKQREHLRADLIFVTEQLNWIGVENNALRQQVEALQRGEAQAVNTVDTWSVNTDVSNTPAPVAVSARNTNMTEDASSSIGHGYIEDLILARAHDSTNVVEAERLVNIYDHMQNMRTLYEELGKAEDPKKRNDLLHAIITNRLNIRELILEQRVEMIRARLEEAGITDPEQQDSTINALSDLQESPYFNDPFMVWGVGARTSIQDIGR